MDMAKYAFLVLLLVFSLVSVIAPRAIWFVREGWKFRDTEPSNMVLAVYRIKGIVCFIAVPILYFVII